MPLRRIKRRPLTEISCGDLNVKIELFNRAIRPSSYRQYDASERYTSVNKVWAKIETLNMGRSQFNEVNVKDQPTHSMTIRYRSDVNTEMRVEYGQKYFEIVEIVDPEERHEYLILKCKLKGSISKEANI